LIFFFLFLKIEVNTPVKKDLEVKITTNPDLCFIDKLLSLDIQIKNTRYAIY
jgi:hypothetical protein